MEPFLRALCARAVQRRNIMVLWPYGIPVPVLCILFVLEETCQLRPLFSSKAVPYGSVQHSTAWYGMVRYGTARYGCAFFLYSSQQQIGSTDCSFRTHREHGTQQQLSTTKYLMLLARALSKQGSKYVQLSIYCN